MVIGIATAADMVYKPVAGCWFAPRSIRQRNKPNERLVRAMLLAEWNSGIFAGKV